MRKTMKVPMLVTLLFLLTVARLPLQAQVLPGQHPGYLRALTDLRNARWLLYHQAGDTKVYEGEDYAIQQIEVAIGDIKAASIDDGKNLNDHPVVDLHDKGSRLARALDDLHAARNKISGEEDDPTAHDLRRRSFEAIERALSATNNAHDAWLKDNHH